MWRRHHQIEYDKIKEARITRMTRIFFSNIIREIRVIRA